MPSRNLLLLPHYPKNRPEAAPRVSNGSAWRLAAGSGDYCGAESPSLGFVGLGSARGGVGSGARATGMPFRLVVRGMFPETSSRTAGPVDIRCVFFYLLLMGLQAQQPKNCALRAALCSPCYK